jgi:hypothetical protein
VEYEVLGSLSAKLERPALKGEEPDFPIWLFKRLERWRYAEPRAHK